MLDGRPSQIDLPLPLLRIVANAGPGVGWGHVIRCGALASAWRELGGAVDFFSPELPADLLAALQQQGIQYRAIPSDPLHRPATFLSPEFTNSHPAQQHWLVLDSYGFTTADVAAMNCSGRRIAVLNDGQWELTQLAGLGVDLVWGPLFATPHPSLAAARIPQLTGLNFALLRPDFRAWRERRRLSRTERSGQQTVDPTSAWKSKPATPLRCLISLGGTVPPAVWRQLQAAIAPIARPSVSLDLVLGSATSLVEELREWCRQLPGEHRVHCWPADWLELMAQADCAISAAGGTLLELLCLGVPTLAGAIADNQRWGGESLASRQLIDYVGGLPTAETSVLRQAIERLWSDEIWRDRLSQHGVAAVDGSGAQRTAAWLRYGLFRLRPARQADSSALWELRNEPDVRANAFNTLPVPWADHQSWFARKLNDTACRLWVIESDAGEWLGQVRWDIDPSQQTAVFSFALMPAVRGWGLASRVIRRACDQLLEEFPHFVLQAHVKPHNVASRKAFLRVGFEPRQDTLLELPVDVGREGRA